MQLPVSISRVAPALLTTLAVALSGCAMSRQPMRPDAITSTEASTAAFDAGCGWQRIDDRHTGLVEARSITHTIKTFAHDTTLEFIPKGQDAWDIRNTGNGLSFLHAIDELRVPGCRGITGRWAGWRTGGPVLPRFRLIPDGGGGYLVEKTDRLYIREDNGTLSVSSDAGVLFSMYIPEDQPARGAAVILTGLDAGHNTRGLVDELAGDGWAVVQIYNLLLELSLENAVPFTDESTPSQLGADLARLFETRHCTIAGATDATLAVLREEVPGLATKPLVVVGLSAGALYTPAVAASLGTPPDATVLVAGGASVLRVLHGTTLATWKGPARPLKRFLDDHLNAIDAAFVGASPSDPFNTAPLLDRSRTLVIHARDDGYVPRDTGETLWRRAGEPERWVFPGGHAGLFLTFSWHADDIAEWIGRKVHNTEP